MTRGGGVLIASLLLCVGTGATTVREAFLPGGEWWDFNDHHSIPTILPDGTTEARGFVGDVHGEEFPDDDAFAFTDLQPGASFTASLFDTVGSSGGCCSGVVARIYDESLNVLAELFAVDNENTPQVEYDFFIGTVPISGELRVHVGANTDSAEYSFTLDAPRVVVPEPATGLLVAAGLCAVALRRRK